VSIFSHKTFFLGCGGEAGDSKVPLFEEKQRHKLILGLTTL
jgi:hypothetical protein